MHSMKTLILLSALMLTACGGDRDGESETPPQKEFTLQPQAIILAGKATTAFIDADSIVLTGDTSGIEVGKVLISTEGDGYLRKVISTEQTADGLRVVTEQAGLTDAFAKLDIHIDKVFGPADFGQVIPTGTPELLLEFRDSTAIRSAVSAAEIGGPELSLVFKKFGATGNSGVEISGDASFRINPQLDLSLEKVNDDRYVLKYRFGVSPSYRHQFTAKAKYGGAISMNEDEDVTLGRFIIPNTPIVVVPVLIVAANAQGSAAGAFGTTYTASVGGGAFIQRDITGAVTTGSTYQPVQTGAFDLAESTLAASVTPLSVKIEFRLYGVAGPNFGFDMSGELSGTFERNTLTSQEGIRAKVGATASANVGAGGKIPLLSTWYRKIDGDFSVISVPLIQLEKELANEFFPFSGAGAVTVFDNGAVPDDIFEVSLDGLVLGRTSKGGSGQFRLSSLRPGTRQLTLTTVEDDSPPGTYAVVLAQGLTFTDGGIQRSGGLSLGSSTSYSLNVPSN